MAHTETEQWRAIDDYPGYEVSDHGRVRSYWRKHGNRYGSKMHPTAVVLATRPDHAGYIKVSLCRDGKIRKLFMHRLVLEAFVGPCPEGMETLHGDRDKSNNRLTNIRWGTKQENMNDMKRHGTTTRGERHRSAKLTPDQAMEVRRLRRAGMAGRDVAKRFGIHKQTVYQIALGQLWKHLPDANNN